MASLDILCFNPFNLKNKIMKIEHKKIFRRPSKILKNISWPINICLKYLMAPTKILCPPPHSPLPPHSSYILNVRSLGAQKSNLSKTLTRIFKKHLIKKKKNFIKKLKNALSWNLKNALSRILKSALSCLKKTPYQKNLIKNLKM